MISRAQRRRIEDVAGRLVGLLDAAEILGWRRQALWTELHRQERRRRESPSVAIEDALPTPVGRVRATRLFLREEFEAWRDAHPERCPNAPALKKVS